MLLRNLLCCFIFFTFGVGSASGQITVFSENIGSPAVTTNTPVATYTTFQNTTPVIHSGTAQVSASTPSVGYAGVSGGNNIFFTSNTNPGYSISNINISGATNVHLRFGVFKNLQAQNGSNLQITVVIDGNSYALALNTLPAGANTQGWYAQDLPISAIGTSLRVTFASNATGTNNWFRIDDIALVSDTPLPLVFGAVEALKAGNAIQLKWSTVQETNNDHFEIEASSDGSTFAAIRTIQSLNGNSNTTQYYEVSITISDFAGLLSIPVILGLLSISGFKRQRKTYLLIITTLLIGVTAFVACNKHSDVVNIAAPDKIFLRIKQVDEDGTFLYSKVVQVIQ